MSKTYFSCLIKDKSEVKSICSKLNKFYPADKIVSDLEEWLYNELIRGRNCKSQFGKYANIIYDQGRIDWGIPDGETGLCETGIELVSTRTFLRRVIERFIEEDEG